MLDWPRSTPEVLGRELEGSTVFVDVSGFTKMSERLARQGKVGAEEVSDVIGDTFGALLAEAYAYGGSLIKFGGDALLLFFQGEAHALRAAAAAHGMRAELRRIGTFSTTAGKVTLRMSVGAHAGLFHFFLVGGSHRELIVAGPAATETIAMEGAASAGQILISPALAAALPRANVGRRLGPGYLLAGRPPELDRREIDQSPATIDLTPFVPAGLRETLEQAGVEPEHRSVTVAFLHYGEFDAFLAREGLEAAASELDELVRNVQQAVDERQVTFLATDITADGGKIILTAGAPSVTGNDEEQMLLALRAVVAAERTLPLHIGVNRGPVFAGEIGPSYRRTYTVMGDAVNLAARLMAKAEHGQIVATPEVLEGSRTLFETTELEPFLVKGKREPIQASVVGEARGSRGAIAEAGVPLVGRDVELASLLSTWDEAAAGSGRLVEIAAEPGMGKSRLIDELLARTPGATVLRADCRLYQSATPYFPFRALLRDAFGLDGATAGETVAALEAIVAERAPHLVPWTSLIGTPLDLAIAPTMEVEELEDEFRKARLEEAVTELVAATVMEPTVFLFEDTHWMDEPSRDLLGSLSASIEGRPWLVLLSRRPGTDGFVAPEESDAVRHIALAALGTEQAAALIDAATADAPLMPRQVRTLAERAQGNPLFLIELLEALRRGEDVESLPASVEGLIQARIDRLAPGDRRRLREMSVLGTGFRVEHVTVALAEGAAERVSRALRRLGDFLSVDRTGWVQFRHALIRDAAYEGLAYRRRQELHARIGDSILVAAGDDPEDAAELLSLHYSYARRWPEAWRFSRVAGDRAREVYANHEAARFYERALGAAARLDGLDDHERIAVATRLCEVREHAGLYAAALDSLRTARKLAAGDPIALADIHVRRARVLIRMGSLRAAYRATTTGYRLVEVLPGEEAERARARLSGLGSNVLLVAGRYREALPLAHRAVAQAEAAGDRAELAHAYLVLDDTYARLGRSDEAVFAERAVEIYSGLGDLPGVATVENSIGVRAYAEGRWNDSVAAYMRAEDAFRRAGNEAQAALVAANIGEVLVSQRRFDEAEPVLREAVRVLRAHGAVSPALFGEIQLGRLQLGRGEVEAAVATLTGARDEGSAMGSRADSLEAGIHLARATTRAGDARRSLEILDEEQAGAGDLADYFAAALAHARAEALVALGRLDDAANAVTSGLASAQEHDALYDTAQLLLVEAEIAARTGSSEGAEALQEAGRLLQRLGAVRATRSYGEAKRPSTAVNT